YDETDLLCVGLDHAEARRAVKQLERMLGGLWNYRLISTDDPLQQIDWLRNVAGTVGVWTEPGTIWPQCESPITRAVATSFVNDAFLPFLGSWTNRVPDYASPWQSQLEDELPNVALLPLAHLVIAASVDGPTDRSHNDSDRFDVGSLATRILRLTPNRAREATQVFTSLAALPGHRVYRARAMVLEEIRTVLESIDHFLDETSGYGLLVTGPARLAQHGVIRAKEILSVSQRWMTPVPREMLTQAASTLLAARVEWEAVPPKSLKPRSLANVDHATHAAPRHFELKQELLEIAANLLSSIALAN